MIGFVVRRMRGRLPLAAAALLTALITTTTLTALLAFTRNVDDAATRQALTGPGHARTSVLLSAEHALGARAGDDANARAFGAALFGPLPFGVESVARSRSYGLPGGRGAAGGDADLTVLAALDQQRVRLLAGRWPEAVAGGNETAAGRTERIPVAVPQTALSRLRLDAAALPAEVRLDDRYGGAPLTVLVTGVYRAIDRSAPYWRLDPLGGRELQVAGFATYGPMLVHDSAFTAGALVQDSRATLLTADFSRASAAQIEGVRERAPAPGVKPYGLTPSTELPEYLRGLDTARQVARSTLAVGALQLAVLAAATLLLVTRLLTERQEAERVLLTARGASRRRLGMLTATESLLLALPAAALAPLLTPPLLRVAAGHGPPAGTPMDTGGSWVLWPVAAGCALLCVLLTALPAVLRGAAAGLLARVGGRRARVSAAARSGLDLAVLALALLAYRQLDRYGGSGAAGGGTSGGLGVDPVLVAAPTLALCAGTLLVLRVLPFAALLGGWLAARGRGLGRALVGWQFARRPAAATGPVLLLVLAVSSGVLALGRHTAWSDSQRDQASFSTAGGLRITGSDLAPLGQGGRYAALPGGDRATPVLRTRHALPDAGVGELLALDSAAVARAVPLRSDLRDGRPMRALFGPLAVPPEGGAGIELPGTPGRIDLDVSLRTRGNSGDPRLGVLLRDRFGLTHRAPPVALTEGEGTVSVDVAALAGAPFGSVAPPLTIAGFTLSYGTGPGYFAPSDVSEPVEGEVTLRRVSVTDSPGGAAAPVTAPAPAWDLATPMPADGAPAGRPVPAGEANGTLMGLRYQGGTATGALTLTLTPARGAPAELPGLATVAYLRGVGAEPGDVIRVRLGMDVLPVRITGTVASLPVAGERAIAVDLAAAGRLLATMDGHALPAPDEWWLPAASADDPAPARAAAELRASAGSQQVLLSEDVTAELLDDPLSAGPQTALAALAVACAVLAAIGFAAAATAAARRRARESAILLALGAPRRALVGAAAAEGCVLVGLGTAVGLGLGAFIVHTTVPLMVLTPSAERPVPHVRVDLPELRMLALAAAIAVVPLLSAVLGGRRDRGVAARLRHVEEM
ncbi:FtsX-like permease family protein [Streptomyces sp. NPDC058623]|uniref:FtsX-like permease family protein n=1 Tax=Streptomyces sp. NPDC058623 TaxID=3346563 RepID=UPI00364A4E79